MVRTSLDTMRAVLTAVVAAIEAAAVALAVFALIAVPSVLLWWLMFDLDAEPNDLFSLIASLWQLAHLVPLQISISAQAALGLGFAPEAMGFAISLAPLGLTLVTVLLAVRSGWRAAARGGGGAWAVLGGLVGFGAAATTTAMFAGAFGSWPMWARVAVPVAVYSLPQFAAFLTRSGVEQQEWWLDAVRSLQRVLARVTPNGAAAFPERAAETLRLAAAGLAVLAAVGALGATVAILFGYVDIVTLSQQLHLDAAGALLLFLFQLLLLPIAWIWALAWFAGPGFSIGQATSVTPFESLLGPLPALPLFGALPEGWGWAGALAPAIIVAAGAALGGVAAGRPSMRRASSSVAVAVPVAAAVIVGFVVCVLALVAGGSIGPGRLSATGPVPWQVGLAVTLELAFGMSLGVFARRVDLQRVRELVPSSLLAGGQQPGEGSRFADEDQTATMPVEPLRLRNVPAASVEAEPAGGLDPDLSDLQSTQPLEPLVQAVQPPPSSAALPSSALPAEPPGQPDARAETGHEAPIEGSVQAQPEPDSQLAVDPLLQAFSWDSASDIAGETPKAGQPGEWRDRLRSRLRRD